MSTSIDIVISGYARSSDTSPKLGKFMSATGSSCLVRSSQQLILFDTMGPWEKDLLVNKLEQLKVHPDDIKLLVCSHSHPDHIGNLNLFTRADKHIIGTSVYTGDTYNLNCFEPIGSSSFRVPTGDEIEVIRYEPMKIDSNITVKPTPGHTVECVSMVVENCENLGTIGLVGDLFENENDIKDEGIWLGAGSQNPDLQRANRSFILNTVDHILPGHGVLFKTHQ